MHSAISAILSPTNLCPWWWVLTFWRGFIHRDKSLLSWNPSFYSLLPLCLMVSTKTILTWCVDNIPTWFYFPSPADGGTEVSHSTLLFWICSENRWATQNTCFIVWRSRITDSYLPHRPFKQVLYLKKFFLSLCMLPKRSSILGSSSLSLQTSQGHLRAAITTTPSTLHCYGQELQGVHQDRTEVIKVI